MSNSKKPSVGLIGLGIIGSRVAASLRREGYPLFVWNRTPHSEPNFLASPAEVAEAADIVQIFVRDGAALMEVIRSMATSLTSSHVVLNHATVSPDEALEAAELVNKHGAQFLNAPFTGSRDAAADGKLVYFAGGSSDVLKSIRPILEASSEKILMMGSVEAAAYIKIATNVIMAAQVEILAEVLEFLTLGGVPLNRLGEALQYSVANSGVLAMKMPLMLQGDFEPRFSAKNMLKDIQFALDIIKQRGVELPVTAVTAEAFRKVVQSGLGDADVAALATQYDYSGKEELLFPLEAPNSLLASASKSSLAPVRKKSFLKTIFTRGKNG